MRVSGKHNDFREVGHSTRHHTFFEMLGNFSFGDYFKPDAIRFAWELVTREYGLDPKRLRITVFREDEDARRIWEKDVGVAADCIFRLDEADNFWAMGETGPCGPCSEIHYDYGQSPLSGHGECDLTCSCGRWVEVWNLVFMQFNRDSTGRMTPLPSPSIDTGMGLERITTILQGKATNYDTDLFRPLLEEISDIANTDYGMDAAQDVSMRIIADHARAAAFVVADGQYPGNDKRGYVLRKIMRRAIIHGKKLNIEGPFLFSIAGSVIALMKGAYPDLVTARDTVARVIKQEEVSFADTLEQGLKDFDERVRRLQAVGSKTLPGEEAFFLYDTRGLPIEIIEDLAQEQGLLVDEEGFVSALNAQRDRSRQDYKTGQVRDQVAEALFQGATAFVGYDTPDHVPARIVAILVGGESADIIEEGKTGEIILDQTPFYAESGGQVGDSGSLWAEEASAQVTSTLYRGTTISHLVTMQKGTLQPGDVVNAKVDMKLRHLTMKNHTATHLLHAALKNVLGGHVKQAGSLVEPNRLRFDFSHYAPLSRAELEEIEDNVNDQIWNDIPLQTNIMDLDQAMQSGAVALFGEKYQQQVRVVEIAGFSRELCGGTHVRSTGMIGLFKIISEGGISAGVRRLEALTGPAAFERFRLGEQTFEHIQEKHKISASELPLLLDKYQKEMRDLELQIAALKLRIARMQLPRLLDGLRDIAGVKVLAGIVPEVDRAGMRTIADELKQTLKSGVVVLGTPMEGRAALVVMVTPDLAPRIPAGKIIREIAALVGGSGGGKPEIAEAGGKDSSKLADALEKSFAVIEKIWQAHAK